jgi:hypothetical protein
MRVSSPSVDQNIIQTTEIFNTTPVREKTTTELVVILDITFQVSILTFI